MPPAAQDPASIMVAAFEPFAGRSRNRALQVLQRLRPRPGMQTAVLPVDFRRLCDAVPPLFGSAPRALLLIGESSRRNVAVEQVALNVLDSDKPDNAGRTPHGETLVAGSPLGLRTSWDARAVAGLLQAGGVPAQASFHAGTYACNSALYLALQARPQSTRVGFLHVPHARWPLGLRLSQLVRAAEMGMAALMAAQDADASAV